jgi:hypothetical protein
MIEGNKQKGCEGSSWYATFVSVTLGYNGHEPPCLTVTELRCRGFKLLSQGTWVILYACQKMLCIRTTIAFQHLTSDALQLGIEHLKRNPSKPDDKKTQQCQRSLLTYYSVLTSSRSDSSTPDALIT